MNGPRYFPEAVEEYEDCVAYYEEQQEGLGARLILELDDVIAFALEFPDAAPRVIEAPADLGLRWIMARSFPVKMVFTVPDDTLLVVAVLHARRRPGYWRDRLGR